MDFQTVILKKEEHIATIIMNQPDRLNAVNTRLGEELITAIDDVARDDEMRVLILTGAGRAFCAGGEVTEGGEIQLVSGVAGEGWRQTVRAVRHGIQLVVQKLQSLDKPTIAMVNGPAVGAGFDFALACDLRIGSENAQFRVGYTRVGLPPGCGGTWLMPRVMGLAKAAEFLFTGDSVKGEEAEKIGLLNRLVPTQELERETKALASKIARNAPIALRLSKLQLYKGLQMDLGTALEVAAACESIAGSSEDHKEGVKAFLEKREATFVGR